MARVVVRVIVVERWLKNYIGRGAVIKRFGALESNDIFGKQGAPKLLNGICSQKIFCERAEPHTKGMFLKMSLNTILFWIIKIYR